MVAVRSQPGPRTPSPAPGLEPAQSESGEDDADDAHQVDFETQTESHGQEAKVDGGRRHQSDHRPASHQLARVAGREKAAEKLAEE